MSSADRNLSRDRYGSALLMLIAVLLLGHTLQLGNGTIYNSPDQTEPLNNTIGWMLTAFIFCFAAVVLPRIEFLERFAAKHLLLIAILGITWQFYAQIITSPGSFIEVNVFRALRIFILLMTIAFASSLIGIARPKQWGKPAILLLLLSFTMAGIWLLRVSPNPYVDVHVFHRDSTLALLQGKNPYTITFPDIYGKLFGGHEYGEAVKEHGRVNFGYPYLPLTLLLTTAAQAIYGDYRLAQLLALMGAGGMMAMCRRSVLSIPIAAIFLLSPRILFVLEQGYVDPFSIFFFACLIWAACRSSRATSWLLGLFLASKQYIVLAFPIAWLLKDSAHKRLRMTIIALFVAAVITIPFLAWSPEPFVTSTLITQFRQPFREDSLSFLAWFYMRHHVMLSAAVGFLTAGIVCAIAWFTVPRTPAGIAAAIALEFFAFFAFNKQAFANYYLLVIGMMCCAIAAVDFREES